MWERKKSKKDLKMTNCHQPSIDAALRVVLNVRETEQMKALKEENEKLKRELEKVEKVTTIIVKNFLTQAQMYLGLITDMEAVKLISAPVAEALRQQMAVGFRL